MRVLSDESPRGDARGAAVAVGVFDGVHRGHQAIISRVVETARARNLAATVVTFHPHPARTLDPRHAPLTLESFERRLARFAELGVDQVRVITFDERAALEDAESFVARVLVGDLGARLVVVGEDFRFGRDREGDVALLERLGASAGFTCDALAAVGSPERFSSTVARAAVVAGDLAHAEAVLGHHVVLSGEVIHGDARGARELGWPTANLALPATVVQPGLGIYAGAARAGDGLWFAAAISVGRRPQFYVDGEVLVEVHLVDFAGDLYGAWLDVVLLERLRGEETFVSTEALIEQIGRDVARSAEIFRVTASPAESLLGFVPGQRR